jgi:hypothetical protein
MALNKAEVVATYIKLRDRRAQRKNEYEAADAADKEKQEKIEAYLLKEFNESGVDSIKTEFGTAYKTSKLSVTTADKEAFFHNWVVPNGAWEFLDIKPNKTAVQQYKAAHDDIPPGLNWSETMSVNVRRS